jgi:methylmalonyl-CoA/ethylmalonyl-CoA epimerase
MKLTRVHHIGVVVDDLEEAGKLLQYGFGMDARPGVDRAELRTVFFSCGQVSIELIEVHEPSARAARLGVSERARIEHIAFEVDDIYRIATALEAVGVRSNAPPRVSGDYVTFWTDPRTSAGIMYQFLQSTQTSDSAD